MTITTPPHLDVCKDGDVDRRVDVQTDAGKAPGKDDTDRSPRMVGYTIVLANHKGGVTKTTSTANLGAMFAEAGRRVLIVDCDPQANLSEAFGWAEEVPGERLEDLLANPAATHRYTPPAALQPGVAPGLAWREQLRIIPATDALADIAADLPELAGAGYEGRLTEVLDPLRDQFDVILLDTPPGRGNLSGMAVLAADGLLIPALAADLDVRGAGKLYDLVEGDIPDLRILGVLIAASDRRWQITRDAAARMTADQMRVLPVQVPRAVRVASAPRYGAPTAVLEPDSMVSHAYRQLADLLLREIGR
jgi:chromosome partitioning protein